MKRNHRIWRSVSAVVCLGCALVLPSCTSHIAHSPYIKSSLVEQNFDDALERIEKISKKTSGLLYYYEKGLVLHYKDAHEESNAAFESAELLYDELYTKSVTRELGSLLTSDNIIKYTGEKFEIALIHYYKILNYLYLGLPESALVECRRLNHRLQVFSDAEDTIYPNDPFLQYLTGMVYHALGDLNDAGVSLRNALDSYNELHDRYGVDIPDQLYCDLATMSDPAAASAYRDEAADCGDEHDDASLGALNLFLESGYVPFKIQEDVLIPLYKDEVGDDLDKKKYAEELSHRYAEPRNFERGLDYVLRVSIPVLISKPFEYPDAEVRVVINGRTHKSYAPVVENLEALALEAYENRKGGIIVKTIVRGLTKYLAKKSAEEKKGKVAGWLINAFNVATETADTRSWTTLPQSIRMSRLLLPEGTYDVEVTLLDVAGQKGDSFSIPNVIIKPGQSTFLNYRVY